jgi:glycosyltransferase involved in cell wall biosynthesis
MTESLQLSVVVPMYNAAPYLEACVHSLLAQDLHPSKYEILLVNDGSKDETRRIAENLEARSPNIKLVSQENKGQGAARNLGFARSAGEFVWFVDADDIVARGCFGTLLQMMRSHNLDIVTIDILRVLDRAAFDGFSFVPGTSLGPVTSGIQYIATHNYDNGPWGYIIRAEYLRQENIRFVEGHWCEDGMFSLSAIANARRVARLPRQIYGYVLNPNSNMSSKSASHQRKMLEGFLYAVDYFDRFIKDTCQASLNVPGFKKRVACRRDSYVFFLVIRLLRARLGYGYAKAMYGQLLDRGRIPLRDFCGEDYPGLKYKLLSFVVSTRRLFLAGCCILNVLSTVRLCDVKDAYEQ